jgi:glycosyltransferase involved in cell wall biosynthesis
MSQPQPYSLIIATFERPDDLAVTFAGVEKQTRPPAEIIVVDSSRDDRTQRLCQEWAARLPIQWHFSDAKSAAKQRNQGAELARLGAVFGFMDDDITLYPDTCQLVLDVFDRDADGAVGGVAVRIDEIQRPPPSRLARWYYRVQAGYAHPTYGARLFGPGINCLPCYTEPTEPGADLIRADWLNSGCVFYRREPFLREKFPAFDGYSYMEDVHCSARIGRTHRLYFHTRARCSHREGGGSHKRDVLALARQRIRHQRLVARDVMGLRGPRLVWKFFLHRLFVTFTILRQRGPGWWQDLRGTWM